MSSDSITKQQRKGIHDRARTLGYQEGLRSGFNQTINGFRAAGCDIGALPLHIMNVAMAVQETPTDVIDRFNMIPWHELGVGTIEELTILDVESLHKTLPNHDNGRQLIEHVDIALQALGFTREV